MNGLSKRVVSLAMATAMVLSAAAIPTTDANAASKYSLDKKRTAAYVGKTYSYSLKGVSKSQYAKVSVSGTAKNLVKVKLGGKTIKPSTKITGTGKTLTLKVKASKASGKKYALTAKIYNKKNNKLAKTLKSSTVTVYNHSIKSISGTKNLVVGESPVTLTAVKKYSQSKGTVKWSSSNTAVATVSSKGVVTAVAAGTSVITAKCGSYTKTTTVTVTEPAKETGISAVVTNAVDGYPNTVFVNQTANLVVTVRDEAGKPVPNVGVTWTPNNGQEDWGSKRPIDLQYGKTTNANGQATFLIGEIGGTDDVTSLADMASVNYTITVDGNLNAEKTFKGTVNFAALSVGTVKKAKYDAATDKYTDIVLGKEAEAAGYVNSLNHVGKTVPLAKDETSDPLADAADYVASQQVSSAGTDEHAVTFTATANLVLPATSTESTDVLEKTVDIEDGKSGEYHTYDTISKVVKITEDSSKLRYATLYINNIKLSEYSRLVIRAYTNEDCEAVHYISGSETVVHGEQNQSVYAYQIPVTSAVVKAVKLTIESAGQVDADMNDGFEASKIKYVFNDKAEAKGRQEITLEGAEIKWEIENPVYSEAKHLDLLSASTNLAISPNSVDSKFTYQVPVFPYTGMAVITEKNKNNEVIAYYLAPTENEYKDSITGPVYRYYNRNEIAALVSGNTTTVVNRDKNAYKATSTEIAAAQGATIKQENNGRTLIVNSEAVGYTNVKGTITIPGVDSTVLNAANKYLYTSVQWNPLPKKGTENNGYIAINGQQVTVVAQLIDKNGNPVTKKDASITFAVGGSTVDASSVSDADNKTVSVVKNENKTDVNGQAKLTLSSGQHAELAGTKAISASTTESGYDVVLYVGGATVATDKADVYWVDANLSYYNYPVDAVSFNNASDYRVEVTTRKNGEGSSISRDVAKVKVQDNWEFASRAVGDALRHGVFAGKAVNIDGLTIYAKAAASNKGTYTFSTDGKGIATGTSKYAQKDFITNYINGTSVGNDVTFTVGDKTIKSVGTGSANIDASIKLGITWQTDGSTVKILSTNGKNAVSANNTTKKLYIKLSDKSGVNGIERTVNVKVNNNAVSSNTASGNAIAVSTNSQGIAEVYVVNTGSSEPTIVTVTESNDNLIDTTTINWVNAKSELALLTAKTGADMKTVELMFNNDIEASSVQKDQFDISYKNTADGKTYSVGVSDVKVNDNVVTLTLVNALANQGYTVKVDSAKVDGIVYELSDVTGETFGVNSYVSGNFVAGTVAPIEITEAVSGNDTITVDGIKLPMDVASVVSDNTIMYVTVNDTVVYDECPLAAPAAITETSKVYSGTLNLASTLTNVRLSGKLESGDVVNVYFYGGVASYTVK